MGNNRVVANQSGTVVQTNHYYPFGMNFAESTYPDRQPWKYNGKELDMENGLNLYDYEARIKNDGKARIKYFKKGDYQYVKFIDLINCEK